MRQRAGGCSDKMVLIVLADYADGNGRAWPSIGTLAAECEANEKTVRSALQRLELSKLIAQEGSSPHGTKVYRLPLPDLVSPPKSGSAPLPKQGPDLCTSSNTVKEGGTGETQRELIPKPSKAKGTLEEVKAFCKELNLPESDATWFFYKCEGTGWTNGGHPIKDWKATIRAWRAALYLPSQKADRNGHSKHFSEIDARRREQIARSSQTPITAKIIEVPHG